MTHYKAIVRNSPGWREHEAATLGVSVSSPNWQDEKFAAILEIAAAHFKTIRIDVTDALYRHNLMAEGLSSEEALARANSVGALWLARHQDQISACPVKPIIIRWAEWYEHPDFESTLAQFRNCFHNQPIFKEAVIEDSMEFYRRKGLPPTAKQVAHAIDYILEEVAVMTLQGRGMATVKLYPGEDLKCLNLLRNSLVADAPKGLEREQFAKIKFDRRGEQKPVPFVVRKKADRPVHAPKHPLKHYGT